MCDRRSHGVLFLAALVCSYVAAAVLNPGAAAANFRVYPTILEVHRPAGKAALGTIDVKVDGEGEARFRAVVQDLDQSTTGQYIYGPATASPHSASAWVSVTPKTFAGGPSRVQPLRFQVAIPANAEPGDHLTSITIQRLPPQQAGTTARAVEAVSARLTVRVDGPLHPAAEIVSLSVPGLADGGPIEVETAVRNTGNETLDFDGANRAGVRIRSGDDIKETLPSFEGKLFPGQTREFVREWDDPPLYGGFDAEVSVHTDAGMTARKAGFTVLPWREAGAVLLVIVAVVLLYFGRRRRRYGY